MSSTTRRALFADLVFNGEGQPAKEVSIGGVPHYAIPDGDFLRHVEAARVDRQIVMQMRDMIAPMRDAIVEGVIHMMGEEGLFARAAIEQGIDNIDRILEPGAVDVDEFRTALWMAKFRAFVDVHGNVVRLEIPGWEGGIEDDDG
jgi:hypothetical protein